MLTDWVIFLVAHPGPHPEDTDRRSDTAELDSFGYPLVRRIIFVERCLWRSQ